MWLPVYHSKILKKELYSLNVCIEQQSPCREEVEVNEWINKMLDFVSHVKVTNVFLKHDLDQVFYYCTYGNTVPKP